MTWYVFNTLGMMTSYPDRISPNPDKFRRGTIMWDTQSHSWYELVLAEFIKNSTQKNIWTLVDDSSIPNEFKAMALLLS